MMADRRKVIKREGERNREEARETRWY